MVTDDAPEDQVGFAAGTGTDDASALVADRTADRAAARRRLLDIGVVVAVVGLLFSATTYWIDRRGQDRADDREARSELTDVVGKMAALPREYIALPVPEGGADAAIVSSNFSSELLVLVAQAERLVDGYPGIVGPADYLSIGFAHLNLGNYVEAIDAFDAAQTSAAVVSDERLEMAAITDSAVAWFGLDRAETGRTRFRRAITRARANSRSTVQIQSDVDFILRRWAQTELSTGGCDRAAALIEQIGFPGNRTAAAQELTAVCGPATG